MKPQISIVVPVYNAEAYLHRCVDSILNQKLQDFEIILVNDGSKDRSGKICDAYAKKDNRIQVIHKDNARVSAARNDGIKLATGKYLGFVDADDWIEEDMYQDLLVEAEQFNLDFAMCDFKKVSNNIVTEQTQPIRGGYYSKEDIENELFPCLLMFDNIEFPPTITNTVCLFNLDFLKANNIFYDEDVYYCEDALFGPKVMYHAGSFYYLKDYYYYNYCHNPNSTVRTYNKDKWDSYIRINDRLISYFAEDDSFDISRQIKINMLYFALNALAQVKHSGKDRKKRILMIRDIMNHPKVRDIFVNFRAPDVSWKLKLVILMIKFKMANAYDLLLMRR